jgi:hypothetical protein
MRISACIRRELRLEAMAEGRDLLQLLDTDEKRGGGDQISNLIFYFPFYILSTIKFTVIISYIET